MAYPAIRSSAEHNLLAAAAAVAVAVAALFPLHPKALALDTSLKYVPAPVCTALTGSPCFSPVSTGQTCRGTGSSRIPRLYTFLQLRTAGGAIQSQLKH